MVQGITLNSLATSACRWNWQSTWWTIWIFYDTERSFLAAYLCLLSIGVGSLKTSAGISYWFGPCPGPLEWTFLATLKTSRRWSSRSIGVDSTACSAAREISLLAFETSFPIRRSCRFFKANSSREGSSWFYRKCYEKNRGAQCFRLLDIDTEGCCGAVAKSSPTGYTFISRAPQ